MSLWLKRELLGIGTLAMLAHTHAEENGSHTPPHMPAVFLTHASPPSHIAADSELIDSAFIGSSRNRRVRRGKGFNRRVSISVRRFNAPDLTPIGAPKLSACAAGIESVRYDFDRFLLSQRLINRWLRLLFPQLLKILKSGIPYSGTFSERK